ncbi:11232_t:CDS:2 [Gigaspora margarita]|uniref:11232_t:CDS:1 n=1 Tax=Gigaspora margarita TaxID=4874 RepID=A0ABN7VBA5_GIGMA|nr:11232_t:CDS:2 [Gigaspora margarita]
MPLLSKGKRKAKNQIRDVNNENGGEEDSGCNNESDVFDLEWGDEDDSGWDDTENIENEIKKLNLVWKNNSQLEKTKRGPYIKGKTPKSTYYDKYRPNSIFTKAAVSTKKITNFFTSPQPLDPNYLKEISDDSDSEPESYVYMINKKVNDLKKHLEQNHSKLTVKEYNYK